MEKVNRNVLETKADMCLADKIDELVEQFNKHEKGQEVKGQEYWTS